MAHGWELFLTNEIGQAFKAWIDWPGHIWIPAFRRRVLSILRTASQFNLVAEPFGITRCPEPIPGSARY